jgi:hypothetical protein
MACQVTSVSASGQFFMSADRIALRTETTINDTTDCEIGRRLIVALREIWPIHRKPRWHSVSWVSLGQDTPVWTTPRMDDTAHRGHWGTDITGATLSSSG